MTRDEQLVYMNYCQEICEKPRRIKDQPNTREGIFVFCEDWEIIEILKFFFNGEEGYMGDPPPNRLKFNPLWNKEGICGMAKELLERYKTPEAIVAHLRDRRAGHVNTA